MYATGTTNAMSGISSVAEYGPELISLNNGGMMLASNPMLMNMQGGETVYNARQTQEILSSMNKPNIGEKAEGMLKILNENIVRLRSELKEAVMKTNQVTQNVIKNVEVNGVTDVRGLIEEMSEYTQLREF